MMTHPHRAARNANAITLEGPQACRRKGISMFEDLKQKARTAATVASLAGATLGMPKEADASLVRDIANDPQHQLLGANYLVGGSALTATGGGTVSFRVNVPGVGTGQRNASAILLNDSFAITAYHNVADLLQFNPTFEIATGSNYMNNRGTVRSISEIIPYPGGGFNNPTLPDVCILRLSEPLAGVQSAVFGSANVGDYLVGTGFGRHGSPATGLLPRDGNIRAIMAPLFGTSLVYNPSFYSDTAFNPGVASELNGRPQSGDSGGGVYGLDGKLVSMWVGGTTGTGEVGVGTSLRFEGEIKNWINSTIPAPGAVATLLVGALVGASRRRR